MYVIRPFRAQGARELAVALVVLRFRPLITILSSAAALVTLVWHWRVQSGRWLRALAVTAAIGVLGLAFLARVNIYEIMFNPVPHPSFAAARQIKLDRDERVIAIKIGRAARAYPIRNIAYHHMVNDVVEGKAIIATY